MVLGSCISRALLASASIVALQFCAPAFAQTTPAGDGGPHAEAAQSSSGLGDIIVTARRRDENLMSVPVTVDAMGAEQLQRYKADNLEKVGELTPGVIIGQTKQAAGGSIAVRGISSSPSTVGFEQSVLVDIDGLPISNGRVVALGFFDLNGSRCLRDRRRCCSARTTPQA